MNPDSPRGITFEQALSIVRRVGSAHALAPLETPLREARGRVLRAPVEAPIALPSFPNSAMDGFAVRAADLHPERESRLRLSGEQFAGASRCLVLDAGACVRITTGAPLPRGADAVVMKENARVEEDMVHCPAGVAPGTHVRAVGEDCELGARVFEAGVTLGPAALGLLAAFGFERVPVSPPPSVAVFTTGDELRPAGTPLQPGEIHDSNRVLLQALLAEEGIDTLSWPALPDDPARLAAAIDDAAQAYDLVITCGGVSAGEKDLLPALLEQRGRIHFWKVMMRPGMPVLFGSWGRALLLGLPGNPVSVLATFRRLALPLLDAMQRRSDRPAALRARLAHAVCKSHARLEFRRGLLQCHADGVLHVRAHPATGSHQQRGAADSNALIVMPADARELDAGVLVDVEPYGAILRA